MKKLVLFIGVVFGISFLHAQNTPVKKSVIIKGKVQFLNPADYAKNNKVWLSKSKGWNNVLIDSAKIADDGSWQIKVPAGIPTFYSVDIAKWDRATVFTDADLTINTRGYDTAKVKVKNPPYVFVEGSEANNFINLVEHVGYRNYQSMISRGKEMYYAGKSEDTSWAAYLKQKDPYGDLNEDFKDRIKVLIRAYKDKPVVIYALGMLNWEKNQDIIMPVLNNLNKKYPWFKDGNEMQKDMEDRIAQAKLLKPGNPVPAISYPDEKGNFKNLDQFKGKYLLIDFWASWCGPCRQAVPKVKDLYAKYKDKGFEVVSISIDDSKKAWEKAMEEEKMPWQQWLSPDKNETMKKFLFSGIPTLYIVDKEGKIIGSYTGFTEDVSKKIDSFFK